MAIVRYLSSKANLDLNFKAMEKIIGMVYTHHTYQQDMATVTVAADSLCALQGGGCYGESRHSFNIPWIKSIACS